jgi:phosphoglycolate phosphatase/AHBA synthesis associated protein
MLGARAVLFDLDGVLIDSYHVWFAVLNAVARDFDYPPVAAEVFRAGWGQGIQADVVRFFPRHTVPELERLYDERFGRHLDHLVVADEVPAIFEALRGRGTRTAVITNTPGPLARTLVERARATPDVIVGGTDVPRAKPAPDMVLHACERLGVRPSEAWVVGDSPFDRDAALAAGARFAGLGTPGELTLERLGELLPRIVGA